VRSTNHGARRAVFDFAGLLDRHTDASVYGCRTFKIIETLIASHSREPKTPRHGRQDTGRHSG
jgi:hypothetical protein